MIKLFNIKEYKGIKNFEIDFRFKKSSIKKDHEKTFFKHNGLYYNKNLGFIGPNSSGKTSILEAFYLALYFNSTANVKNFFQSVAISWINQNINSRNIKLSSNEKEFHELDLNEKREVVKDFDFNISKIFNFLDSKLATKIEWETINDGFFSLNFFNENLKFNFKKNKDSENNIIILKDFLNFVRNSIMLDENLKKITVFSNIKSLIIELFYAYIKKVNVDMKIIGDNHINLVGEMDNFATFFRKLVSRDTSSQPNLSIMTSNQINALMKIIKILDRNIEHISIVGGSTFSIKLKNVVYPISFVNLSFGTKKIIKIISRSFDLFENGGILLIDEIENGLNMSLIKMLIDLFNNKYINKTNASLFFTTHFPYIFEKINFSNESKMVFDSNNNKFRSINDLIKRTEDKTSFFNLKNYYNDFYMFNKGLPPFSTVTSIEESFIMNILEKELNKNET